MEYSILAVDDEIHMLKLLEQLITNKTNHRIITTHNALEVPEILEEQQFELIITDLRMPGLSGLDILNIVREGNRRELVILITAFASLESAIEAFDLGLFDYIIKPFRKERILRSVERALYWQRLRDRALEFDRIFESELYGDAERLFKEKYLTSLAERTRGDRDEMIKKSGLDRETINEFFKEEE
jgi:DNA-binding NtrC family response regulator